MCTEELLRPKSGDIGISSTQPTQEQAAILILGNQAQARLIGAQARHMPNHGPEGPIHRPAGPWIS